MCNKTGLIKGLLVSPLNAAGFRIISSLSHRATADYLGKQEGHGQVHPMEAKAQAVTEFPVPQTKKVVTLVPWNVWLLRIL